MHQGPASVQWWLEELSARQSVRMTFWPSFGESLTSIFACKRWKKPSRNRIKPQRISCKVRRHKLRKRFRRENTESQVGASRQLDTKHLRLSLLAVQRLNSNWKNSFRFLKIAPHLLTKPWNSYKMPWRRPGRYDDWVVATRPTW